jgi:hypothetical protein
MRNTFKVFTTRRGRGENSKLKVSQYCPSEIRPYGDEAFPQAAP